MNFKNNIINKFSAIFYPNKCPYCLKTLSEDLESCKMCKNSITRYDKLTKVYETSYPQCNKVSYCTAPLYYADKVRKAVLLYKFRGYTNFVNSFTISMYNSYQKYFSNKDFDFITYVPLNKKRLRERGYNQSHLLAKGLSKKTNIPCKEILYHCKDNKIQHELTSFERRENVKGAYALLSHIDIKGKSILVVDDIITTKSTLSEICKILYDLGASNVDCICLARAGLKNQ